LSNGSELSLVYMAGCGGDGHVHAAGGCHHDHSAERALFELPEAEKRARMEALKAAGNERFKTGDAAAALALYRRALALYHLSFPEDDAGQAALERLRLECLLNAAAAGLRLRAFDGVVADATEALGVDGGSVKARFRRAQARRHLGRFDEAAEDLDAADAALAAQAAHCTAATAELAAAVAAERAEVDRGRAAAAAASRRLGRAMFGGGGGGRTTTE
jgi:tetratricopeptide (TPR) repeat protein